MRELCIKWLFYFLGAFFVSEKECLFLVAVHSILNKIKKKLNISSYVEEFCFEPNLFK